MLRLFIIITACAAVCGSVVSKNSRQGSLNKYYFYSIDNPNNPVEIPADITPPSIEPTANIPIAPTASPTTVSPTTVAPTTVSPTSVAPTTVAPVTEAPVTEPTTVDPDAEDDHPLYIDNGKPTMVIVHGHGGDGFSTLNPLVKNQLFKGSHDHNVIVVDWSSYTKQKYAIAANAVASVGTSLGSFLNRCADQRRINATITHLVGFNLGAHVVGFAGRVMDTKPARITGLDPSKSQWGSGTPRLSKDDAVYVEVIHTDGSGVLSNGIGTAIGNIDFFVNGGNSQPGCVTHQCCHNRAYEVFAATLSRDTPLIGNKCNSNLQLSLNTCRGVTVNMGGTEFFKLAEDGIYRVDTRKSFPF